MLCCAHLAERVYLRSFQSLWCLWKSIGSTILCLEQGFCGIVIAAVLSRQPVWMGSPRGVRGGLVASGAVTSRVGIFGGTFDPPHIGHLACAVHARDQLALDEVRLVVAHQPWQKAGERDVTAAHHRLEMTRRAVQGLDRLVADPLEVDRGGPSYSIDTVRELASVDRTLVLIVGADAAAGLDKWHEAAELAGSVDIAVIDRGHGGILPSSPWRASRVQMPLIDVSSSALRERLTAVATPDRVRSVDVLIPPSVVTYIDRHDLYSR